MRPPFAALSRRAFVGWLGALPAARALPPFEIARRFAAAPAPLDDALLAALAVTVLPSELGTAGARRAAAAFALWVRGYTPGAELDHPYGSSTLTHAALDPSPAWGSQLAALERDARAQHARGFARLDIATRQALVRAAVGAAPSEARVMPPVGAAPHVAVALMSHFFASSEAADLCYGVAIGKQSCRPLSAQRSKPLQLTRAASGG